MTATREVVETVTATEPVRAAAGADTPRRAATRPTIGSVLRRPRFSLLVFGQTVSQFGDKLHHMALIALVGASATAQTGGLELAKLSVVFTAPVVLFGPLAGALVDRWNKRLTMIICDALRALLVLAIPALYHGAEHLWMVYVVAFFVFLLGLFFNSAKMSLIPDLVSREELLPANAALTFIGRFATVGGIFGGGIMIGAPFWARFGWPGYAAGFYLDALSYLVSVLTLIGMVVLARGLRDGSAATRHPTPIPALMASRNPRTLSRDLIATMRIVTSNAELRFVFVSLVLLALFAATVYVAMTLSVQTVMGKGMMGVGYLGGMLAGGMIIGSFLVGTIGSSLGKKTLIIACTGVIGVLMMLGGVFFSFRMFAPVAVIGGALLAPVMVAQDTLLHEHAPASSRALLFSTRDLVLAGVFVLSAFAVGGGIFLFGRAGVEEPYRLALVVFGAVIVLASIAIGAATARMFGNGGYVETPLNADQDHN
ncbi:MAG: MFS transporter [Gemmatimonadota bacterium]